MLVTFRNRNLRRKCIMQLVKLTHDNIEQEHICCAIANKKDVQVMSKKNWLKKRLDEGLVFLKCDVRGKCFIEYILTYCWISVSRTAKKKEKKDLLSYLQKRKCNFQFMELNKLKLRGRIFYV